MTQINESADLAVRNIEDGSTVLVGGFAQPCRQTSEVPESFAVCFNGA